MVGKIIIAALIGGVWMMVTARVGLDSFLIGFVVGLGLVILFSRSQIRGRKGNIRALLAHAALVMRDVLISDLQVAYMVLTNRINPGLIEVPVNSDDDTVAAMSAHAITLTPGTLVVEFNHEKGTMLIHALDIESVRDTLEQDQAERARRLERMLGS